MTCLEEGRLNAPEKLLPPLVFKVVPSGPAATAACAWSVGSLPLFFLAALGFFLFLRKRLPIPACSSLLPFRLAAGSRSCPSPADKAPAPADRCCCLCFLSKSALSCTRVNCSKSPISVFANPSATEAKKFDRPNKGDTRHRRTHATRIAVVFHQLSPLQQKRQHRQHTTDIQNVSMDPKHFTQQSTDRQQPKLRPIPHNKH